MNEPTLRLEPPLRLPKFTFLFGGPPDSRYELATAIADRDPHMLLQDLEEPLRMATHALFYGGFAADRDFTKAEERSKELPTHHITVEAWLTHLRCDLRDFCGQSSLGRIAAHNWIDDGNDLFFDRGLYRDADNERDLAPFIEAFGASEICCIHLDLSPGYTNGVRYIWLPVPETKKRMELLEQELAKGNQAWISSQQSSSSQPSQP